MHIGLYIYIICFENYNTSFHAKDIEEYTIRLQVSFEFVEYFYQIKGLIKEQ